VIFSTGDAVLTDILPDQAESNFIARLQSGDERAAEELVGANAGWMLSVARRYLVDTALAEDCVQDAFMNAFQNIESFEGRSKIKSWLHRILVNAALTKIRKNRRHDERPIDNLLPKFDEFDCRIEASWPDIPTPAEILENTQIRNLVADNIHQLPQNYRIVLLLRDIEEMSTAEVSKLLEVTEGTVKIRLHRARAALKKLLEPILRGGK
jgi:RNA polymerase sigma-70 factor (ECF subfamily)